MTTNLLDWGPVSIVRRNHGLEHATLNLLSKRQPGSFAGHSDSRGFWIIGNVSTDLLLETAREALLRLNQGERELAIHPYCGTNFVTTGVVAGSLAWLFTLGRANSFKKKLDRWPLLIFVATAGAILANPLGFKVQEKVSTSANPGQLAITQIVRYERKGPMLHRILTGDDASKDTGAE
jgi:hypothetical protein